MTKEFEQRYIKARRAVVEAEFSHLNAMQRRAVMTTEGPLLILAGAGSGKTTVLINRIANLLKYGRASDSDYVPPDATEEDIITLEGVDTRQARALAPLSPCEPWRIIAITFTNKAADELKARLESMLGPAANDIWAMTFHSACVRILRRDADRLGFPRSFTIYDTSDSQSLMKRILKELDLDEKIYPHKTVLSQISKAKDAGITPDMFEAQARASGDPRLPRIAMAYREYTNRLFQAGAMDFDDLISHTVTLLSEHADVREYYQQKFRYVLIDEYQDTNNMQYRLASLLCGSHENICVVGDDDQSIYKFRGATIENILSFEKQYENARVIRLEQNYRSTGHILNAANSVIRNNTGRKGKELWTNAGSGDKLRLYIARDESDEAQFVAQRIIYSRSTGGSWRDNAVLYRMNAQSNQLENAFKRSGIPYRIVGGMRFFDRAEIKDVLAYMNVILSPQDDLRLIRIVNTPARGISSATVEKLQAITAAEGGHIFAAMERADRYPELQRAAVRLRQFTVMINDLRELSRSVPLDQLYDAMLEKTGYLAALQAKASDENLSRIENVQELKTNILSYIKETGDSSLEGFMDEVALYTDLDNMDRDADSVVMMTMHSAKGLEFPNVYIVGAEEGIFPGTRAIGEQDEMEEERRLCYVALTRARKQLYISCAKRRMLFGRTSANKPSRFLDEISDEDIDRPDKEYPTSFASATHDYIPRSTDPGVMGRSFSIYSNDYNAVPRAGTSRSYTSKIAASAPKKQPVAPPSRKAADIPAFSAGDRVSHKAFGSGVITKMTPMGGDHLIEIEFDGLGTKRLMLRAASRSMIKDE